MRKITRMADSYDLVYERSRERCRSNVSWGFDDKSIWVDQGCRAEFLVN